MPLLFSCPDPRARATADCIDHGRPALRNRPTLCLTLAHWHAMQCLVARLMPMAATAPAHARPEGARGRMIRKSTPPSSSLPMAFAVLGIAALGCAFPVSPASALEEGAGEAKAIDACDKRLCSMVQGRDPKGEDLKCALTKTWAKSTIKEADQRAVKWDFGDARCTVQIDHQPGDGGRGPVGQGGQAVGARAHRQLRRRAGRPGEDAHRDGGAQDRVQGRQGREGLDQSPEDRWPARHQGDLVDGRATQRQHRHLPSRDAEIGQPLHLQALSEIPSAGPRSLGRRGAGQARARQAGSKASEPAHPTTPKKEGD